MESNVDEATNKPLHLATVLDNALYMIQCHDVVLPRLENLVVVQSSKNIFRSRGEQNRRRTWGLHFRRDAVDFTVPRFETRICLTLVDDMWPPNKSETSFLTFACFCVIVQAAVWRSVRAVQQLHSALDLS